VKGGGSGDRLRLTWRPFLLEQINADKGPDWKAWEDENFESRDIPPLVAAKCAALQGEAAFDVFHRACFRAQHLEGRAVADHSVLLEIAQSSGLDLERFQQDLTRADLRALVGREHEEAVERWGIFGVPTLVYPSGEAAFLKLAPGEWEALGDDGLFDQLMALFATRPYLLEVKKPEATGFKKPF
jgi:protein-disulfide isomerase-like protein with CxxC motif